MRIAWTALLLVTCGLSAGVGGASAATSTRAYVANTLGSVSVFDTANSTMIASIPVGVEPRGVAVNPAGTRAYVTNQGSGSVSVIDTATNIVIASIPVGDFPVAVAINPAGTLAYVANFSSDSVSVIDPATNTVIATIAAGDGPFGVAVTPDGSRAYVTNINTGLVSVIDTASNAVIASIPVGAGPIGVAVNPVGTRVYVTNSSSDSVSVIDTATNTVIAPIPVGDVPRRVAVTPDGTHAYVTNQGSASVSVIDTATNTAIAPITVGSSPLEVSFNPAGTRAYVANGQSDSVSVIDTATNTVLGSITVSLPSGIAVADVLVPPAAPVVSDSDPDSPANENAPHIMGTAGAGSTVALFDNPSCSEPSVASGSAAAFASPGFTVGVPDDSSTTFYATATDPEGTSACSASGLTYVEDSTPPDTVIDTGPAEGSTTASTVTFTFHATEAGSTFGCKLDSGPVLACDAGTKTYAGLVRGSHTFSVVATDAAGNSDSSAATRTWTVNTPPVATGDAYGVIGGATLTVAAPGVLGDDTDADGDALTAQLVGSATKGTLSLNPNGSFTYTPGEDATGTDSFTYRAFDGLATSDVATVTITITAGCDGVRATRVGTAGNDKLSGTSANDVIVALGGNDTIDTGSGNDRVCGGSGNDALELGSGNDRGFGGAGSDSLRGGSGDDILAGGEGNDTLDGGGDRDQLFGDGGVDRLFGGGDPDALDGGDGSPDRCDGEGGKDTATAACEQLSDI